MDEKEIDLEVWKATLEVQRHFNELGLRVRSLAITVLGAFMAAAGYAFKEQNNHVAGLILSAGLVCWLAFYFMDRAWYHRLLRAAVRHGEQIEANLKTSIPNIGLTTRISMGSPVWGFSAGERLTIFYAFIGFILWSAAGAFFNSTPVFYLIGTALFLSGLSFKYLAMAWRRAKRPHDKLPEQSARGAH